MNKIRIATCVEGRQNITEGFLMQIEYLREATGMELPLSIAASEDKDIDLITGHPAWKESCSIVQTPNDPLSEKHNKMLQCAMREKDWDVLIHLGSDDLMSAEYVTKISELEIEPNTVYGVNEMYFYNAASLQMMRFKYKGVTMLGAGRVLPRKVLEQTKGKRYKFRRPYYGHKVGGEQYLPEGITKKIKERSLATKVEGSKGKYVLWVDNRNSGLDNASGRVLTELGVNHKQINHLFDKPQIIDIKTHESLTPWSRLTGQVFTTQQADDVFAEISPILEFNR